MYVLNATLRRLIYVTTFEAFAILFSTLLLTALSNGDASSSLPVAIAVSVIAVVWNFIYNSGFEAGERKLGLATRTIKSRIVHSIGFEGGLVLFTVPIFMFWYQVGMIEAVMMEAALLVFFLIYTFVFTLVFDQIFALPQQKQRVAG